MHAHQFLGLQIAKLLALMDACDRIGVDVNAGQVWACLTSRTWHMHDLLVSLHEALRALKPLICMTGQPSYLGVQAGF